MTFPLKTKELQILSLFTNSETPLTISDIVEMDDSYTTNIVQPIVTKLYKLKLLEIAEIVYRKKALTRAFRPTSSAQSILQKMFFEEYKSLQTLFSNNSLLASLLQAGLEENANLKEIEHLEKILSDFKKLAEK